DAPLPAADRAILLDWLSVRFGPDTKPFPRTYVAREIATYFSDAEAESLIARACSTCHGVETVNNARNTEEGWRVITVDMRERGAAPSPPPSPLVRLEAAIKAAPTCGYIWGQGVTGYSIKYAWRAPSDEAADRIVLVTDRRLGAHASPPTLTGSSPAAAASGSAAERDFTVIEMRLDGKGTGVAKASLDANVIVDAAAKTLALEG